MVIDNLTFNYVVKAYCHSLPVILKINCVKKIYIEELLALQFFSTKGCARLIKNDDVYHAILLEQVKPGTTLKSIYVKQPKYVMRSYVEVVQKLHAQALPINHVFKHVSEWPHVFDQPSSAQLPAMLLQKAIALRDSLLKTSDSEKV